MKDLLNINEFGARWSVSDAMKQISEAGKGIILLIDGENNKVTEFNEINASRKKRVSIPNNDPRRIGIGSQILRDLGVKKIKLMEMKKKVKDIGWQVVEKPSNNIVGEYFFEEDAHQLVKFQNKNKVWQNNGGIPKFLWTRL